MNDICQTQQIISKQVSLVNLESETNRTYQDTF